MRKTECFIVVIKTVEGETQFCQFANEEKVINAIFQMTSHKPKHPRDERVEVKRVFGVNEFGETVHYELAIVGFKPVLRVIPEEMKDDDKVF